MNNTQEALAVITDALNDDTMPVYHALRTLHALERKSSFNEARVKLLEQQNDTLDKGYAHTHRLYEASQRALGKVLTENRINAEALEVALAERDALRASLRVLLDWCVRMQVDEKHLIGSVCKQADDLQFRAAIERAREALG